MLMNRSEIHELCLRMLLQKWSITHEIQYILRRFEICGKINFQEKIGNNEDNLSP